MLNWTGFDDVMKRADEVADRIYEERIEPMDTTELLSEAMMNKQQEKDIIRTLVKAGHVPLAKQFARSRGYRVTGAFSPGDKVKPTDAWYDEHGGRAPLPAGAVGVIKKMQGGLAYVEFPEDKGKVRRMSSVTLVKARRVTAAKVIDAV